MASSNEDEPKRRTESNKGTKVITDILRIHNEGGNNEVQNVAIGNETTNYNFNFPSTSSSNDTLEKDDTLEEDVIELQEILRTAYENIAIPNVPFMDNGKLLMEHHYVQLQLQLQSKNCLIILEQLFDEVCDNRHNLLASTMDSLNNESDRDDDLPKSNLNLNLSTPDNQNKNMPSENPRSLLTENNQQGRTIDARTGDAICDIVSASRAEIDKLQLASSSSNAIPTEFGFDCKNNIVTSHMAGGTSNIDPNVTATNNVLTCVSSSQCNFKSSGIPNIPTDYQTNAGSSSNFIKEAEKLIEEIEQLDPDSVLSQLLSLYTYDAANSNIDYQSDIGQNAHIMCIINNRKGEIQRVVDVLSKVATDLRTTDTEQASHSDIVEEENYDARYILSPKRILITAPPGYGKTTLAHKLIYDWARKSEYTRRFKLAFLIPLRNLESSLMEEIIELVKCNGFKRASITDQIISKHESETLIILDGFDEIPMNYRHDVLKVLHKLELKNATVIITSRTGGYDVTQDEKKSLFRGIARSTQFYDRHVTIKGLSKRNVGLLLKNCISPTVIETVECQKDIIKTLEHIQSIEEIIATMAELFECPLFIILLAFILEDNPNVEIESGTDLYTCLIDCMVRRNFSRLGIKLPAQFTLFDSNESLQNYRDLFYRFGKMSDRFKNNLQFDCTDDTDEIYKMGFLIKHETKSTFTTKYHYEVFHLTILEFAVAFSMWTDYKNNGRIFLPETIDDVLKLQTKYGESCLIIPFLCGLLGDEMPTFFDTLRPYAAIFSSSSAAVVWSILSECKYQDQLPYTLLSFLPPANTLIYSTQFKNQKIVEKLVLCKRQQLTGLYSVERIELGIIPRYVNIRHLSIAISYGMGIPKENCNYAAITCKKLKLTFTSKCNEKESVQSWLHVFRSISATKRNLTFCTENNFLMDDCIRKENLLQNIPINKLICYYIQTPLDENIVTHLISNNELKELKIGFPTFLFHEQFTPSLSFEELQDLQLTGLSSEIDLSILTNNGKIRWKKISMVFMKVRCSSPITDVKCISVLGNICCSNSPKVFNSFIPDIVHCGYNYLVGICNSSTFANGWNSVKELTLELHMCRDHTELALCLAILSSLESLAIRLHIVLYEPDCSSACDYSADENLLIESLKSLNVIEILLQFPKKKELPWRKLHRLPEIMNGENIRVRTLILINYNILFEDSATVNSLLGCLNNGNVNKIVLCLKFDDENLFKLITELKIDCTKYHVRHETFRKWPVDLTEEGTTNQCICITLKDKTHPPILRLRL